MRRKQSEVPVEVSSWLSNRGVLRSFCNGLCSDVWVCGEKSAAVVVHRSLWEGPNNDKARAIGGEIVCGLQKTGQTSLPDFLSEDRVEPKGSMEVRSIIALEDRRLDGTATIGV